MPKSVKEVSERKKLSIRNHAKEELERLETIFSDTETIEKIDRFKNTFAVCESVYKIVLAEHQLFVHGVMKERMLINMKQAPHALKFAGYNFDKDLLTSLFGAEERIGKRSVKKLRDSLTHNLNKKAIEEYYVRESELYGIMYTFLNIIRTFDDHAA